MASYWSKRRRVIRTVRDMEKDILKEYEETLYNNKSHLDPCVNREPPFRISHVSQLDTPLASHVHMENDHTDGSLAGDDDVESDHVQMGNDHTDGSVAGNVESDSDSDSHDEHQLSQDLLMRSLRYWATSYSINLVALSALLSILKLFHPMLPKDGRTLLRTQHDVATTQMQGGEYYHFGLVQGILSRLKCLSLPVSLRTLTLQFNIDGLPLFKSSRLQFWPILAILKCDYTKSPFIVGIFCALSKPKCVVEYLQQFISDLKNVLANGVVHNGNRLKVLVSSFVCDAPARAYVKNIKSHNGYSGCDKCDQHGVWRKKMTYPETNVRLRTDSSYCDMIDEEHHLKQTLSPLTGTVKMVSSFPIDYMHLCCLGVMRKLLNMWLKGNLATRLPSQTVNSISSKLLGLHSHTPCEFNRKPRGLNELDRWKATELRSFILYWGPVVLKDCLPSEIYDNFMLFSVAMYLFLSPGISGQKVELAHRLMISFVEHFGQLYGRDQIVFSVHQLIHLADEYKQFGPLDNVSGFPFENYLGQIKHLLRKPHQPLQQVVKRLSEQPRCEVPLPTDEPVLQKIHTDGPLPQHFGVAVQYTKVSSSRFTLSTKQGDNCIEVGHSIAVVQNIVQEEDEVYVIYKRFRHQESYYTYPCESSCIGTYKVRELCDNIGVGKLGCIKRKCVLYPESEGNGLIAIPIAHMQ
ncbi:uncharacterized protein LOC117546329 isoform X1 [Gymnodraco acuticeps]|uniref:Uncharacterized protein LOC117539069 isoform X1 n=1 Tax=Gymnodraco acuticeps TaxID=8218 RepID=A0A6P8TRU9_GYMAC|nr:uncharacterized protein LOC117539069 isoform X1 [Gymnodraco acuticeps]XP_034072403.1 uncharacterized protein LOC117546329 isoform X1 [Gymnodraco acuticeps]XP_034072415.1 uncharacterized protein LOC117546329 isoform X1 [Gymnodraco acuticeps]